MQTLSDWNVVVTLAPDGYQDAVRILRSFGEISRTAFRDVLVMRVATDIHEFLERLHELLRCDKTLENSVSRIIPAMATFSYASAAEFRARVTEAVRPWADDLAGKTFHVRVHRRGFSGELDSRIEERSIGDFLIQCLEEHQRTAHVGFDDPEVIVAVETVGEKAGASRWSREDLQRYELLRLD